MMTFKEAQEHIKDGCPKCGIMHWSIKYSKMDISQDYCTPDFVEKLTFDCPCGYTFESEPKQKD
jgi:predicted  nucleic acid-binding Zn-ribbon protein